MGKRDAGGAGWVVLLLTLILVGFGAWNYRQNLSVEREELAKRPFANYTDAALEALKKNYRVEISEFERLYAARYKSRVGARDTHGIQAGVREFERVQKTSYHLRDLKGEAAEREAMLRAVEQELGYRGRLAEGAMLHIRRLLPRFGD